ncbi:MAG: ATP/GTP-binding protein [Stigonema ocellatum SAG 48.90 = DSM 106950]|nr:ATP/GTP-binding protein [Stigonema ocellatum SAG 48.90 = DSM 106950]
MDTLRIVVTGGVGSGKTSLIRTISEIEVVDTDKTATDEIGQIKAKTTVALDFGRLGIAPNQSLHLYGTPGQRRFEFMWEILIAKAHAYILLVDAHRPEHLRYGRRILNFINQRVQIPYLIGLTHTDCPGAWEAEDVAIALGLVDQLSRPQIMIVNATDRTSVIAALIALIQEIANYYQSQLNDS